ncbi:MAG: MogA/MoaB family molybdenum cofactor biosynthesis protein [Lachnospiraceae bacterium]|nr:MogA/MoaB family molybdenum cofactor biosynthesis protein [Candidatus Equihabitans merdae]
MENKMRVYIITSSDSGVRGEREDKSGPLIAEMCLEQGYEIVGSIMLPDERQMLSEEMARVCDEGISDLILTTGGTGFSPRDITPEATMDITERIVPGIPEAMRMNSMKYTNRSMLSRATAGIRKQTLIINLPGSPKAVKENLEFLFGPLEHGLEILTGKASNCARK